MKRVLIFTLLFVYTTLMCGVNLQLHYCGGKLKSISLNTKQDEAGCCGKKRMKKKGCCDNKTAFFKVKDKHNSNLSVKVAVFTGKTFETVFAGLTYNFNGSFNNRSVSNYHAPPVLYDNPIYLKYRVLII